MKYIGLFVLAVGIIFVFFKRSSLLCVIAANTAAKGNVLRAERIYKTADKIGTLKFKDLINYGYFMLKNGRMDIARVMFGRAAMEKKINKTQKLLLKSLQALLVWKEGHLSEAIEMLEEVTKEYKTSMTYQSLGLLYILNRDKEKAMAYCTEAYEYNSDDNVIMDNLAEAYVLCGDKTRAMEIYEELIGRNPSFPDAYYGYGILLLGEGRREEAVEYLGRALSKRFSFLSALPRERVESIYLANLDRND